MAGLPITHYRAELPDQRVIEQLDAMTLIYQRRSGITHIVAEPVPEILAAMGEDIVDAKMVAMRLVEQFKVDIIEAEAVVVARLEELATLGLVEKLSAVGA